MEETISSNKNTLLLKKVAKEQLVQATTASILQNSLIDLQDDVNKLRNGMVRILSIIDNDDRTDTPGVVKQQRMDSDRLDKVENKIDTYEAKLGVAFTFFIAIGAAISFIINLISFKIR